VTEFSWQWGGVLQEGESYSLRIGQPEKPLTTFDRPRQCSCLLDEPPDGFGHYHWQVAVVWIDENGDESDLSKSSTWSFTWCGVTTVEDDEFPVVEDSDPTRLDVVKNDLVTPDTCEKPAIVAVGSGSAGGTISIADDNSIEYQPAPDFFDTEVFTYTVHDGTPSSSHIATVTVTVKPVNDPPIANDDAFAVEEDSDITGLDVLSNDSVEPDKDEPLMITEVGTGSRNGAIRVIGSSIAYEPAPNFFGTETFSYTINDGTPGSDATAAVTVIITPVNDAPIAVDDTTYRVNQDSPLPVDDAFGVLANDSDVDGDPLTAVLMSDVSHGILHLNSDGSFNYTPNPDFYGSDSFTYKANDGNLESDVATVTITVTAKPTPIPTPMATRTPTPTLLPAPILLEPENGTKFCPQDPITLKWEWSIEHFQPNEYYAVRIWKDVPGEREWSRCWHWDRTKTTFETRLDDSKEWFKGDGKYFWNVAVVFWEGQIDEHGYKIWELRSEESETWWFIVRSNEEEACWP